MCKKSRSTRQIMDIWSYIIGTSFNIAILYVALFFCVYLLIRHVFIDRSNGLPPGPKCRLPLVGNLYAVDIDLRQFLRRYRKKYGDIYSLYFGNKLVVVIAGIDNLRDAFLKKGKIFSDRPVDDLIKEMTEGFGLTYAEWNVWNEHHKFCITALKELGFGSSVLENNILEEVQTLLRTFHSNQGKAFDPDDTIHVSVSNVIKSLAFGNYLKADDEGYRDMLRRIRENFAAQNLSGIGIFIPALSYLPGDLFKIKLNKSNSDAILGFLLRIAKEKHQKHIEGDPDDFTSLFIKEMKKQQAVNESTTFSMKQLNHLLRDLFFAGSETVASILRWALVYLVNYPDLQEELYQDVISLVGQDRLPSLQDRTKLLKIDAFMYECLRHANLVFTGVPHATTEDTTLHGYYIPKGTTILPDMDSVFSDNLIWKDAEAFRPSRFIDEDGALFEPKEFIPFFVGKRTCVGEPLARMEMFLFYSAIVQHFKISAPPDEDLSLKIMDSFGFTHVPKPFNIIVTPREKLSV